MWSVGMAEKAKSRNAQPSTHSAFRATTFGSSVKIVDRGDFRAYIGFCNAYSHTNFHLLAPEPAKVSWWKVSSSQAKFAAPLIIFKSIILKCRTYQVLGNCSTDLGSDGRVVSGEPGERGEREETHVSEALGKVH